MDGSKLVTGATTWIEFMPHQRADALSHLSYSRTFYFQTISSSNNRPDLVLRHDRGTDPTMNPVD
jgi:hypothetical protein